MKKILGLTITAAALLSFANSFADDHSDKLEDVTKHFEKLAIESGKLTPSDQKCWGDIKKSLGIK
jgi:hypothetical protein